MGYSVSLSVYVFHTTWSKCFIVRKSMAEDVVYLDVVVEV